MRSHSRCLNILVRFLDSSREVGLCPFPLIKNGRKIRGEITFRLFFG